jgi:hypothetical protein
LTKPSSPTTLGRAPSEGSLRNALAALKAEGKLANGGSRSPSRDCGMRRLARREQGARTPRELAAQHLPA